MATLWFPAPYGAFVILDFSYGRWFVVTNPPPFLRPPVPGVSSSKSPLVPPPVIIQGEPSKASAIPLFVAAGLLLLSLALYLLRFQLGGGIGIHLIGYLLAPLLSSLVLGWDVVAQRQGRKDPWFEPKPNYSRIIRIIVALGFVVAIFHIIEVGIVCGQGFVQTGVLCGA